MAKREKSKKRTVLIIVASVIGIIILVVAGLLIWATRGLSTYSKLVITDVDLTKVPDGSFQGSFDGGRWSNTVEVTVKDHKITDIMIVEDVMFKRSGVSNELFSSIEKEQSLEVDTVTGATVSSKAYLKSIENALDKAR